MSKPEEISIDDIKYIRADSIKNYEPAKTLKGMDYVIVRTYSAGVFAGYLASREGKEVVLNNARRLWYWKGAASLSQLAMEGVKDPDECKFPIEVSEVILTEVIEVIPATKKAQESIKGVTIWEK